jgi:hypothetical protein
MSEKLVETQNIFSLNRNTIIVREAGVKRIDVSRGYRTSAGPLEFDVVIEFGNMYKDMAGSTVLSEKRWKDFQHGDARIMANHSNSYTAGAVSKQCELIADIVETSSPQDPQGVKWYSESVEQLTKWEKKEAGREIEEAVPIVALRAGLPMTEALGYKKEDMVLLEAKRLNGIADPNRLALGLRFVGNREEIMEKLKKANGKFLNADPALATGSTQLGILLWLLSNKIEVSSFTAFSIGAAQQGLEMLNQSVQELRDEGHTFSFNSITAGLHPTLTAGEHPYYIKTEEDRYAVGDGGDYLDLLLPPELRRRWGDKITRAHLNALNAACKEDITKKNPWIEEERGIDLETMCAIQRLLNSYGHHKVLTGDIFKKEEAE